MQAVDRIGREQATCLILTVPRAHELFSNNFSANHTNQLAYQSTIPVMAVHG